jgi:hypothetical protein
MNRIRLVFPRFTALFVAMLLSSMALNIYAAEKDCWVNFFEEADYAGKRLHIDGPAQLENLAKMGGENWDKRIHSIKVGPKAKVTVYQNPRFELTLTEMAKKPDFMSAWGITEQDIKEDTELLFNANDTIHDLGDFNFHKKIRSLKVDCL